MPSKILQKLLRKYSGNPRIVAFKADCAYQRVAYISFSENFAHTIKGLFHRKTFFKNENP